MDWTGALYSVGHGEPHWRNEALYIMFKSPKAAKSLLSYNLSLFLDLFLLEKLDLIGNLYLLPHIREYTKLDLNAVQVLLSIFVTVVFQNPAKAKVNVRSHYDISQKALNHYLDRAYLSYSCGNVRESGTARH